MKSRREANTRFRLVLTLGLAVVLPALTLIFVNFQHVKSIQRDKKVEALIHRDFQYLLSNSAKKISGKAYEMTEQARDAFPSETDSDDEKRRKLDLILDKSPWFAHVFLFDAKKGVIVQQQRDHKQMKKSSRARTKMYSGWLGLEGRISGRSVVQEDPSRSCGTAENPMDQMVTVYTTTAIFAFPQLAEGSNGVGRRELRSELFEAEVLSRNCWRSSRHKTYAMIRTKRWQTFTS